MTTSGEILARLKALHPRLIDLSLGRIERLLSTLGHPERRLPPIIHVAGTNGKGSVTAFLAAMLAAAGKRVHVYTSPHLVRFNERIGLAGPDGKTHPITNDALIDVLARTERANAGAPITLFEITTAAAFVAFAETPADVLLLEVGLGGRLDATNVVARPALSVITPISIDHTQYLGDTIEAIAAEKAGILKRGVTAVVAQQVEPVRQVLRDAAAATSSRLFMWGEDFEAFEQRGRLVYQSEARLLDLPLPALLGPHQIVNAGTAVAAALNLPGFGLTEPAIERGLLQARWPARMQRLIAGPLTDLLTAGSELWLDGGHNEAAGRVIAQAIADLEERAPKPLFLVAGMMAQKNAAGFLQHFRGLAHRLLTVPVEDARDAAHPPEALAEIGASVGLDAEPCQTVEAALQRAQASAGQPIRVVICGSLYLAGHVLARQEGVTPEPN
ncbi:MAG: folylpolyglutamate synthase/dihydrofolate synthase family protein [Hyphomicrobiaceae bacterium]